MTRQQLQRALSRRTGESLAVLRHRGFQFGTLPTPPVRRPGPIKASQRPVSTAAA